MSITAIIVTYNSAAIISSALACVAAHPRVAECVVVDNASSDDTLAIICAQFPKVRIIINAENVGFGRACNQVLIEVKTEFALLMNPDATINEQGLSTLLGYFEHYPNAAIMVPVIEGANKETSSYHFRLPVIYDKRLLPTAPSQHKEVMPVVFASGALALWRIAHMRRVGFFDPAFFLFYEDDDISIRTLKKGYDILLVSGTGAQHKVGMSCALTEEKQSLKRRSSLWSYYYMQKKYRGWCRAKYWAYLAWKNAKRAQQLYNEKHPTIPPDIQPTFAALDRELAAQQEQFAKRELVALAAHQARVAAESDYAKVLIYEENWRAFAKQHEVDWAAVVEAHAAKLADHRKQQEQRLAIIQRKQEYDDKILAAWQFLQNARRFTA